MLTGIHANRSKCFLQTNKSGLTSMRTLFYREHSKVVAALTSLNPQLGRGDTLSRSTQASWSRVAALSLQPVARSWQQLPWGVQWLWSFCGCHQCQCCCIHATWWKLCGTRARRIQITKCLQNLPDDQQAPSLSAAVPHIWTDLPGSTRPPESHSSTKLPKGFVDLSGTRAMGSSLDPQQPPAAAAAMLSTQCGACLVMGS